MARNKYPDKTVSKILDVSEALFERKGYYNSSMQDIINALSPEMTKGAIYHHFSNKGDILLAVFKRMTDAIVAALEAVAAREDINGAQKFTAMGDTFFKNPDAEKMTRFIRMAWINSGGNPGPFTSLLKLQADDQYIPMVTKVLEEGKEDGSITCDNASDLAEVSMYLILVWILGRTGECSIEDTNRKLRLAHKLLEPFGIEPFSL